MAWIFVVQGVCFNTNKTDEMDAFRGSAEYKGLEGKAKLSGFVINEEHDGYEESFSVFFGKELYEDRHIYCGQTICAPLTDNPIGGETAQAILAELRALLVKHFGDDMEEREGVVISQFD